MYDFTERKILITGSSRGIGRRIAEDFISLGARVLITGTNETLLREVKDELGSHLRLHKPKPQEQCKSRRRAAHL